MPKEQTVLDYFKAWLTPWRGLPPPIPELEPEEDNEAYEGLDQDQDISPQLTTPSLTQDAELAKPLPIVDGISLPWRALIAIGLALIAQLSLEPSPGRTWGIGLGLYILAAIWTVWANTRNEWVLPEIPFVERELDPYTIRQVYMWIGAGMSILAFITFGGNRFTLFNLFFWLSAIILLVLAFWLPNPERESWISRFLNTITQYKWDAKAMLWAIALLTAFSLVVFFRLYRLMSVPPEMFSDHAEKLLDIWDILHGNPRIFFPRNTGREALQMYLTAGVISLFGTGYTFSSLKIGTTIAGLITLPFVYLLGKEIANKRVGLISLVIAGIAYWPNVITRVALRFTLYPLFVAAALYFLIRGIRRSSRNDFILAGVAIGLGLHGYTPFRIFPLVAIVAVALFLLHSESKGSRKRIFLYMALMVLIALVIFLPLLRIWLENPIAFWYRALSRVGILERPLPGPAWRLFRDNLWNAMTMFGWNNGETWPVSVPYRPALDVVSAAFFYLGIILILVRYVRRRSWLDLLLFFSVPLLLLPSVLSLAFPSENPVLNRTAGAIVPVFIIVGITFDGFLRGIESRDQKISTKVIACVVGIGLLVWSGYQNYDLVFNQYQMSYSQASWNTSEIGQVIHDFTDTIVDEENTYVVAYPHWVDTRLVGMNAGYATRDFAIWPESFTTTLDKQGTKLFIIKPEDTESINSLQELYPESVINRYESKVPGKDFFIFLVIPNVNSEG
jgi:hypothetical protein